MARRQDIRADSPGPLDTDGTAVEPLEDDDTEDENCARPDVEKDTANAIIAAVTGRKTERSPVS